MTSDIVLPDPTPTSELNRLTARTDKKDALFFSAIAEGHTISESCRHAGSGRRSVYEWKDKYRAFDEAWSIADAESFDLMEKECDRRAFQGVQEPVFYQGKVVGHIQRFSDSLLMFGMKRLEPAYRENAKPMIGDGAQVQITTVTYVLDHGSSSPDQDSALDVTGSVAPDVTQSVLDSGT